MENIQPFRDWALATLREAAWAPLGVFLLYFIAYQLELYFIYPPLDIPTHFLGGAAIAYFFLSAISNSQKVVGPIPYPVQLLFALTSTGTTAVLWEFVEFSIDFTFGSSHMLGIEDTMKDLFLGLLGGLVCVVLSQRQNSHKS